MIKVNEAKANTISEAMGYVGPRLKRYGKVDISILVDKEIFSNTVDTKMKAYQFMIEVLGE